MALIQFVENYDDLSTDLGYQFKFYCDRCRNGYMSSFQTSVAGLGGSLVRAAGSLLGGVFSSVGHSSYEVQRAVGGKAHDSALQQAVNEVRGNFQQCKRCSKWVCNDVCWNAKKGMCRECAPDIQAELAAAQVQATIEQINQKVREKDLTKEIDLEAEAGALCPKCGARAKGKFCPECGGAIVPKQKCAACKAQFDAGAKFCPDCGAPVQAAKPKCSGCGKEYEIAPRFCAECGTKMS